MDNDQYWTEVVAESVQFLGKTKTAETASIATDEIEDLAF